MHMQDEMNQGSDAPPDIGAILAGGTSADADTTEGGGSGTGTGQGSDGFKFGGKSYADQKTAEAAHNKLYGKYSESQGLLKQLKDSLSNPALFAKYSKDPAFAEILGKLGIQQAEEDLEREVDEEEAGRGGMDIQSLHEQIKVDRASFSLEREETRFERKLGRDLSDDEHNAIVRIIGDAPSLTFEQAYKLAFHDKLMREAAEKSAGGGRPQNGNRPRPTPPGIPGTKLDLKKNIVDMNKEEWRQSIRQSEAFQNLIQ